MSFNFLPWPLYALMAIGSAVIVFIFVNKASRNFPKSFSLGLSFASIGAIIAGITKIINNIQFFIQYQEFLKILTIVCTSLGIILIITGAYIKVKDDPEKRRMMLFLIGGLTITIIFMTLIVLVNL